MLIDRIPKFICFLEIIDLSKALLFQTAIGLYSHISNMLSKEEYGAEVTLRNSNVEVPLGKSSDPTLCVHFFWRTKVIYFHRYVTLGW